MSSPAEHDAGARSPTLSTPAAESSPQYATPPEDVVATHDNAVQVIAAQAVQAAQTPEALDSILAIASSAAHTGSVPEPNTITTDVAEATAAAVDASTAALDTESPSDPSTYLSAPWPPTAKPEFSIRFSRSNPLYKNKLRLSPYAESRVRHFLLHPFSPLLPDNPSSSSSSDARLKARSKHWILRPHSLSGSLYRSDGQTLRRHIGDDEIWDFLTTEHVRLGHKGRDRMLGYLKERYIGYTLEELMFVLGSCRVCQAARRAEGQEGLALNKYKSLVLAVAEAEGEQAVAGADVQRLPSPGFAGLPTQDLGVANHTPAPKSQFVPSVTPGPYLEQAMAGGYNQQQQLPPIRRGLYATAEDGLVRYDVPDWYFGGIS